MLPSPLAVPAPITSLSPFSAPFAVMMLCLWLLQSRVEQPSLQALGGLISQISPLKWLGALMATGLSFWALGRYDLVAQRHFGTGFDNRLVRGAGMAAIALSQAIGFGLITGSIARWRLLPTYDRCKRRK